jgi:asparagine synthase (glutamine-hydrolysing)
LRASLRERAAASLGGMCGICGVVQIGGEPREVIDPPLLDHMTDLMTHRGPNDRGTHAEPGVALGVRRLSIVDVDGGHQPIGNEDGTVVAIQNGELYNHLELRDRLRADGHAFATRCDTEVLPHLYERYGVRFPEQLRGMFGVAVWDRTRRRLTLARDRIGIKPLYYAEAGDRVVFASELKSLLASGLVDVELDYEAIETYLVLGYFPGPRTPLAQVRKLMPGQVLVVDEGGARVERYWSYPHPSPVDGVSEDELAAQLLEELEESVRLRLMSDVPLGVMLSGGLDSSLIVALMARNMSEPVKTFSVGFREDERGNELADARRVASAFGAEHHELELSFRDQSLDLETLLWHLDEPIADLSTLGFLALSQLAAEHVTVALSGQGADELFGGYRKHRAAAIVGRWNALPGSVRGAGGSLALRGPARFRRAAETLTAADPATRLLAMSGQVEPELRRRLFRGPLADSDTAAPRRAVQRFLDGATGDPLAVTLFLDGQLALVDTMLHYFDRASMAHSLEVRVPFLDHRFVEFAATVPSGMKVRRLGTKHILRRAAKGIVPQEIIDKRKIGFFRAAEQAWVRAQTRGLIADYLLRPDARCTEFLERAEIERMLGTGDAGELPRERLLIGILMLEVWLSSYLPRAVARTSDPVPVPA